MTGSIQNVCYDGGLTSMVSLCNELTITYTQEAATYTDATSTHCCGTSAVTLTGPAAGSPSGRAVTVPAISAGSVTASQTAAFWALVGTAGSTLYATGALSATQAVSSGISFTLASFAVTLRGLT